MEGDLDGGLIAARLDATIIKTPGKSWAKNYPRAWRAYKQELREEYGSDVEAMNQAIHRRFPDRRARREILERLDAEIENPRWKTWAEDHPDPWRRLKGELVTQFGVDLEAIKQAIDREFPDRQASRDAEKAEAGRMRATISRADGRPFSERLTAGGIREIVRQRERKEHAGRERAVVEQKAVEFLRGLPEFGDSTDARIRKISRDMIAALSPSPDLSR